MQGFLIVIVGVTLMYLVLSGKLNCILAAVRACAGTDGAAAAQKTGALPPLNSPGAVMDNVLSFNS